MQSKTFVEGDGVIGLVFFALVSPRPAVGRCTSEPSYASLSGLCRTMRKMSRDGADMAAQDVQCFRELTPGAAKIKLVVSDVT